MQELVWSEMTNKNYHTPVLRARVQNDKILSCPRSHKDVQNDKKLSSPRNSAKVQDDESFYSCAIA